MLRTYAATITIAAVLSTSASGQTPQPFPRPGSTPVPPTAAPATPAARPAPAPPAAQPQSPVLPGEPTAATLGFAIYPTAQFVTSYDAGRGQRYFIFGTTAAFAEVVTYYRTQLKERGTLVYEEPPTHMFEVGRFRDDTMAFPPGVTVKDWTWTGSPGYPNPKPGAQPARFPTIIMFVPTPAAAAVPAR
ncbi:MAG: hypothetical protein ABL993_03145 [Vicinamibacterales bacterium]